MEENFGLSEEFLRRRRLMRDMEIEVCRRCYSTGHHRRFCNGIPTVACSICFRLNVFTSDCCHPGAKKDIGGEVQVFRFCGGPIPRLFIDVSVFTNYVPALVNTGLIRSRINFKLADLLKRFQKFGDDQNCLITFSGIAVPIYCNGNLVWLDCETSRLAPTIHLELGMDYLTKCPFELKLYSVSLNSEKHWVTRHNEEFGYVYNHPRGIQLRRFLSKHGYHMKDNFFRTAFDRYKTFFSNNPRLNKRRY